MTLCLAWKQGNSINFASDSRLTNPDKTVLTNYASKIFKINVEIYKDLPEVFSGKPEKSIYQATYGLCFCGSYINGSVLADTIENFLSNILIGQQSDISIDNLSNIAFAIYKQVTKQLIEINRSKGLSEVLFGGYCLKTNNFKLYKFSPKEYVSAQPLKFEKEEIILDNQTILIGDTEAKQIAEELLNKINDDYTRYHVLKEIIQDPTLPTVGGNIQVGHFKPYRFKTHGISEPVIILDTNGNLKVGDIYTLSGLVLDIGNTNSELFSGNIHTYEAFFCPFQKEKSELVKQQENQ